MPAFLLRFKANHVEKKRGYPNSPLRIPIALGKIFFRVVLAGQAQKPLYLVDLVGTVPNFN